MNEMQQAAYIIAQAACAQVKALGMMAANDAASAPIYTKDDFDALIQKYGIHHNGVMAFFGRG